MIKPKLVPDAGVTPVQLADVKQRAHTAFVNLFDNKFILTDSANNQQYNLHTDVQFVDSGEHYTVALHVGPDGNGNREPEHDSPRREGAKSLAPVSGDVG